MKVQKPELLRLLLKDAINKHELLIEFAEDGQPGDGAQFLQRKPISPFVTTKVLVCGRNNSNMAMNASSEKTTVF